MARPFVMSFSSKVFNLGQAGGGILNLTPFGTVDARLQNVTVQHLLDHSGGWDSALSGDPMFNPLTIANALSVNMPPAQTDIARWAMGRPLDYTPGSSSAYSNLGYMLLGLIIEQITAQDATAWILQNILQPLGITGADFQLGRTLPEYRNVREPYYHESTFGWCNVYRPAQHAGWPDGAWDLEAMETHGGWIFNTRAYVEFLLGYWINGDPRVSGSANYTFFGSLNGTWTVARQLSSGVSYAAFFNQRADASALPYDTIDDDLDTAVSSITQWPTTDPHALTPPAVKTTLAAGALRWVGRAGQFYLVNYSTDLIDWKPIGLPLVAGSDGEVISISVEAWISTGPRGFFRVEVE